MAQCPKIPALSWCLLQPFELVWLCQSQNEGKFQPGWAGLGTAWEERKVWKVWKVWNVDDVPAHGTGWASRSSKPVWGFRDSVEWWEYGMVGVWNGGNMEWSSKSCSAGLETPQALFPQPQLGHHPQHHGVPLADPSTSHGLGGGGFS